MCVCVCVVCMLTYVCASIREHCFYFLAGANPCDNSKSLRNVPPVRTASFEHTQTHANYVPRNVYARCSPPHTRHRRRRGCVYIHRETACSRLAARTLCQPHQCRHSSVPRQTRRVRERRVRAPQKVLARDFFAYIAARESHTRY